MMKLANAQVTFENNILTASTGKVKRVWKLTEQGLKTVSLLAINADSSDTGIIDLGTGEVAGSDFEITDAVLSTAELIGVTATIDDDQQFTSQHLHTIVEFVYKPYYCVKYVIWTYPDAPGIRTQLWVKGLGQAVDIQDGLSSYCDSIQLPPDLTAFSKVGYYSDTQHRNTVETEIVHNSTDLKDGIFANLINVSDAQSKGIIMVKESSKCVNIVQNEIEFGELVVTDANELRNTGLGWKTTDLLSSLAYKKCFASWLIVYQKSELSSNLNDDQCLALKAFDRIRYPLRSEQDIYMMANTWGSGNIKHVNQYAAREENVLREIRSQADLGIDVQQIDDGWQGKEYASWDVIPEITQTGYPHIPETYPVYPEGWANLKALSQKLGVKLGLWAACRIDLQKLLENKEQGGFEYFKIDFVNVITMEGLCALEEKIRTFVIACGNKVRINWDVTEAYSRMGYFLGREYGNLFLANRTPRDTPSSIIYQPFLSLREAWQLSENLNLNKIQITIQNGLDTNREVSDASLYSQDYTTAIALMGTPIFFHLTQLYTDEQRDVVRNLLKKYKGIRNDLYQCYVFPIGTKPTNQSWSGFQSVDTVNNFEKGYVLLFRERLNEECSSVVELKFNGNREQTYCFRNVMTDETFEKTSSSENNVVFELENPASYLLLQYSKRAK